METMLNKFEWNAVEIKDVFRVNSGVAGTKINDGGNTFVYQIGLKLSGYTMTERKLIFARELFYICRKRATTALIITKR